MHFTHCSFVFADYITNAVWSGDETGGPFDDVSQAGFTARVMPARN